MSIRCRRAVHWFVRFIWRAATVARAIDVRPTMVPDAYSTRGGEAVFIRAPLSLLHPIRAGRSWSRGGRPRLAR